MVNETWLGALAEQLPAQAKIVEGLARAVETSDRWRSLVVGCSLGSGRGDEYSDIDAGLVFASSLSVDMLESAGVELVEQVADVVDVLVHRYPDWPEDARRFAVEYVNGVQLDLAVFASPWRRTRATDVPIVDKDGDLADVVVPPADLLAERLRRQAREWAMLGWWSVSDVAKYLRRDSRYEAAARIDDVRSQCLRLFAAANDVPDPGYGLTSLLDFPPWQLPDGIADTYCLPDDPRSVRAAARAVADLLAECAARAAATLDTDLATEWSKTARTRLATATTDPQ